MRRLPVVSAVVISLSFLLYNPVLLWAQPASESSAPPPIAQQMVREGEFAVMLLPALGLSPSEDEAAAETRLGDAGIMPGNGWIADYPVTPDIMGELEASVAAAADAGRISLKKEEALKALKGVTASSGLDILPPTESRTYEPATEAAATYPDPVAINDYYATTGPPVVTYYNPPPDYYYLYSFVPYPFWCTSFWFPGFFVLNDFYRPRFVPHRGVVFISNHFNDVRSHHVFRVDPVARFGGRTFAGIGAKSRRGFIATGVAKSDRRIFNGPRARPAPTVRSFAVPSGSGSRRIATPSYRGSAQAPAPRAERFVARPPAGGRAPGSTRMPSSQPAGSRSGGAAPGGGFSERGLRR